MSKHSTSKGNLPEESTTIPGPGSVVASHPTANPTGPDIKSRIKGLRNVLPKKPFRLPGFKKDPDKTSLKDSPTEPKYPEIITPAPKEKKPFSSSPLRFLLPKLKPGKKPFKGIRARAEKSKGDAANSSDHTGQSGPHGHGTDGKTTLTRDGMKTSPKVKLAGKGNSNSVPPLTVTITVKPSENPDEKPSLIAEIQPSAWIAPDKPGKKVSFTTVLGSVPPAPVYETQYVTTTFKIPRAGLSTLKDDILAELNGWSREYFIICAELLWSMPVSFAEEAKLDTDLGEKIASHLKLAKTSLCDVIGYHYVPEASIENVHTRGENGNILGMHRCYTTELLSRFAHKAAAERHRRIWNFRPGDACWSDILEKYKPHKLETRTIVNLNLVCLKIHHPRVLEASIPVVSNADSGLAETPVTAPQSHPITPVPKQCAQLPLPNHLDVKLVSDLPPKKPPKVMRRKESIAKCLTPDSKISETRYMTTVFEINRLYSIRDAFEKELMDELGRWSSDEYVVCCEVLWATPTALREPKMEHEIREAVRRKLIPVKFQLCKGLNIEDVPRSQCQEALKNHSNLFWTGAFRYHTPSLMTYSHSESAGRHQQTWSFTPDQAPWESILRDYSEAHLSHNSVVKVNFICLKFCPPTPYLQVDSL